MKKTFALILFMAAAAQARPAPVPVPIQCPDGTTRFVSLPAPGATNWIGAVGVDASGTVVTNFEALARHRRLMEGFGTVEWADGARRRFRIPEPGGTAVVWREVRLPGRKTKGLRFAEVLWVDHAGSIVSNYIGSAYRELIGSGSRIAAAKALNPAKGEEVGPAELAARRWPEPDGPSTVPAVKLRRNRPWGRKAKASHAQKVKPPALPAPPHRPTPEEISAELDKAMLEYMAGNTNGPFVILAPSGGVW